MAKLGAYRKKRDFSKTPEPLGAAHAKKGQRYVIQKHDATRLHYDLRLELDGTMLSWAVTRGPSLVAGEKRLAIHVEDHPIEYNKFEGTIPEGEYGGGTVMIWDRGTWTPEHDPRRGMRKGHLDFSLDGEKLNGRWHLVRMRKRAGERQEPWLLIKATDEYARGAKDEDIQEEMPNSVASGRTMDEIATGKKRVWHSNRSRGGTGASATRRKIAAAVLAKPRKRAPRAKSARSSGKESVSGKKKSRLPDFIPPCLATLSSAAPDGGDWLHEIKLDGYRMQARIAGGVTLKTRTGLDWTSKFPTVADACAVLQDHDAILDGEVVSVSEAGISDFSALQDDLKSGRHDRLVYYVFDLLNLDGVDLTDSPLIDRKEVLAELLSALPKDGVVRLSDSLDASGPVILRHACQMQLEGIVSKRRDAPYHSGRVGDWLKTKCSNAQEFIVLGYEPSDKTARAIRSLLLGYYEDGELRYAGRVGTGWGERQEHDLSQRLAAVARKTSPLQSVPAVERRQKVKWVEPKIVVEIEFRGWTGDGLVRQAAMKGLREDKPAQQVVREVGHMLRSIKTKQVALRQKPAGKTTGKAKATTKPKATAKAKALGKSKSGPVVVEGITLSHPDRIYWEDAGVTKQMLAEHYQTVWDLMRPHASGRVLALLRCPEGATGQCFFQKHASAGIDAKRLKLVPDDGDKSIAIDGLDGLVALVQAGALEIHVRGSSINRLEDADRLVFDLDPGPGVEWKTMIAAAREVRERLSDLNLDSFVKTTGGKGLHVVLPIQPAPWDAAKAFCRRLAEAMVADSPDRYTATIKKSARNSRIFIDYLRNSREATAIAPYSTRARPGASVATPLSWQELGSLKAANVFTVLNIGKRLSQLRQDPWKDMGKIKQRLPDTTKVRSKR